MRNVDSGHLSDKTDAVVMMSGSRALVTTVDVNMSSAGQIENAYFHRILFSPLCVSQLPILQPDLPREHS